MLESAGHKLPEELRRVDELTPFAVEFRYDDLTFAESFDWAAAYDLVRQLHRYVEGFVTPPSS